MFVYLRFSQSHSIVSVRLSLAYSFNIIYGLLQSTCGWLTCRASFPLRDHRALHGSPLFKNSVLRFGPFYIFSILGRMHLITISKLIYIYTLTLGFKFSKKRHRTCWFRKLPQNMWQKSPGLLDCQEGKATAELKFTVVLTSSFQANPAEGWTYTPTKMHMSPKIDQNRDHFKKGMSSSNH